jgi:quinol monooxygenase YgiN
LRNLSKVALEEEAFENLAGGDGRLEETTMIAIRKRHQAPLDVVARHLLVPRVLASALAALLLAVVSHSAARAQASGDAIYGMTALDVTPGAAAQGVALLRQYRDGALKQAGNMGVTLLQEVDWPNRFVIYDAWKDQSAYDANEKAAHSAALRDKLKAIAAAPYDRREYSVLAVGPSQPATGPDTVYMQLHLDVFPPGIEPTLAAAKVVAEAARKGEGNLRYDVVKSVKQPQSHTTFLAAWRDRKAFDAYESSAYAREFRDIVGPLLGSPLIYRMPPPRINHYEVVAAWTDAKAFDAHETAAHTLEFRAATAQDRRARRANLYDQRRYR